MRFTHWLRSFCFQNALSRRMSSSARCSHRRRLATVQSRAAEQALDPLVEGLENRSLLSVSAFFFGFSGELNVNMTAADSVVVNVNAGTGRVQVLGNGSPVSVGSITPSQVQTLIVNGSDDNNSIDVSGVNGSFTMLTSIQLNAGQG